MVFDPISHGVNAGWLPDRRSAMPFYIIRDDKEREELITWCNRVKNTNDKNIRLAIRRVLSAINQRTSPVDAFIDTVIAWENLFGANEKIGSRISVSIANLLGDSPEFKKEDIRKKVRYYYKLRGNIVHGTKEVTNKDALKYRDECLDITIKVMKKLYTEQYDLIKEKSFDRSRILAASGGQA
ncbi:hypothetical protein VU08_04400 [Desulfobulbus sp. F5]|nr:hypothetical protein [Desulfobulbus sp. F5]